MGSSLSAWVVASCVGALALGMTACATSPRDDLGAGPSLPEPLAPPSNDPVPASPGRGLAGDPAANDAGKPDDLVAPGPGTDSGSPPPPAPSPSGAGAACDTSDPGKMDSYIRQVTEIAAKNGGHVPTCPCAVSQCCLNEQACVDP